jgi:hypothetical protein
LRDFALIPAVAGQAKGDKINKISNFKFLPPEADQPVAEKSKNWKGENS